MTKKFKIFLESDKTLLFVRILFKINRKLNKMIRFSLMM